MKKIIILVAAVMIFGLGTATNADAYCDMPFTNTNGWTCTDMTVNCGQLTATGGTNKYVVVTLENYSCDTTADIDSLQYGIMGNANAAAGGSLGGDLKIWGPYKKGLSGGITLPVADCVTPAPSTYTVGFYVGKPMPAVLAGSWADIEIEAVTTDDDGADGWCTIYVQ